MRDDALPSQKSHSLAIVRARPAGEDVMLHLFQALAFVGAALIGVGIYMAFSTDPKLSESYASLVPTLCGGSCIGIAIFGWAGYAIWRAFAGV